jgi:hypothetical protein
MIDGRFQQENQVIWAHSRGYWPPEDKQVDHINGNPIDNRLENLRLATSSQQTQNQKRHADAKNPIKGCRQVPKTGRWRATIVHNGVSVWLGSYATLEEAAQARRQAEKDLYDPAFAFTARPAASDRRAA